MATNKNNSTLFKRLIGLILPENGTPPEDEIIEAEAQITHAMINSERNDRGVVECRTCGREKDTGDFMISLMGRGASCMNTPECIEVFQRQVHAGSTRQVPCNWCHREIPVIELHIDTRKGMLSCVDIAGCQEEQRATEEIFARLREKYPNGTPPGGGTL